MRGRSKVSLAAAERLIDESGLALYIDNLIKEKTGRGRPRQLSVRTMLVGCVLTSQSGRSHLVRVEETLNALPYSTKRRLGLDPKKGVTYRQITRLYALMTSVIDEKDASTLDDRLVHFDEICGRLAFFSAHKDARTAPSIALDATDIETWGTNRSRKKKSDGTDRMRASHRREGRQVFTDPDAGSRAAMKSKGRDYHAVYVPKRPPLFGYEMTTATVVREVNGKEIPFGTTAMRFRPATVDVVKMGLAVVAEHASRSGVIGDVIFDRGYNHSQDGSDFIMPIRAIGGEPVFELQPNQVGPRGITRGALMIDGHPFSPSLPEKFHFIEPVSIKEDTAKILAWQQEIELRSKWALEPHGKRKANGSQVYMCPAHAGKLFCPLATGAKPAKKGTLPVLNAPTVMAPDSVCSRKFSTFDVTDAPLAQRDLYGSKEWFTSMCRRNSVEGFYAGVKDHACENLKRGGIRVLGIVKYGLLVAIGVASVNLRMAANWDKDGDQYRASKSPGRPVKNHLSKHAELIGSTVSRPIRE